MFVRCHFASEADSNSLFATLGRFSSSYYSYSSCSIFFITMARQQVKVMKVMMRKNPRTAAKKSKKTMKAKLMQQMKAKKGMKREAAGGIVQAGSRFYVLAGSRSYVRTCSLSAEECRNIPEHRAGQFVCAIQNVVHLYTDFDAGITDGSGIVDICESRGQVRVV